MSSQAFCKLTAGRLSCHAYYWLWRSCLARARQRRQAPSSCSDCPFWCRHSLHAIASQLSPVPDCTGMELLQADSFDLHCFQTLTGTKFLMVAETNTPDVREMLQDM